MVFDSIGWGEVLVLVLAGLFILGPERLPAAAAWLGKTLRQVREYATGAQEQLRSELGGEFDELRKPLQDLQAIRNVDPRNIVIQHVFDGNNPLTTSSRNSQRQQSDTPHPDSGERSLQTGQRPPFDADTT